MHFAAVTGSASGGILLLIAMVVAIGVITVIMRRKQQCKGKHTIIGIVAVSKSTDHVNGGNNCNSHWYVTEAQEMSS